MTKAATPGADPVPAACVCCRFSRETCDRSYLRGVPEGLAGEGAGRMLRLAGGERIRLPSGALTEGQEAVLARALAGGAPPPAAGFWHLTAGDDGSWLFTPRSLLVLEPDWLFSVSDATHFEFCERQRLVSFFSAEPPNLPLLRGTLVHALFPLVWNGCDAAALEAALARETGAQALKIGLAELSPAQVAADARGHLARLKAWADKARGKSALVSETFRVSPFLGLKGRIDAVWERPGEGPLILGELKTGKSKGRLAERTRAVGGEAELGHLFQLVSYAAMLAARGEVKADPLHACLIYSGNPDEGGRPDILRKVELTPERLRDAVDIRNRLVLLEMGLEPAFKEHPNACNRCRSNAVCDLVSSLSGHADPRDRTRSEWDGAPAAGLDGADAACFRHYAACVRAEMAAVRESLARLWKTTSEERAAEGNAVRLAAGVPAGGAAEEGGRAVWRFVVEGGNRSEFRAGDTVLLSDEAGPVLGRAALGTVAAAGPDDLAVAWVPEAGLVPAWADAYPDEALARRQLPALFAFLSRPSRLKEILVRGSRLPEWTEEEPDLEALCPRAWPKLRGNAPQRAAVSAALRARDVLLVAGPPGSGKTTLIGALAEAMLKGPGSARVLLVAATNRALDQALEKVASLEADGFPVIRLGGEGSMSERVRPLSLAARVEGIRDSEAAALEARRQVAGARLCGVTASTLAGGSADRVLGEFEWVVVDEASQMTVPLGLGAAARGRRLVLIGDDRQLPPVVRVKTGETGEGGWPCLSVSLFELVKERLAGKGPVVVELEKQFRMSEGVCSAPSKVWYGGRLRPGGAAVARRRLEGLRGWEKHPLAAALDPARSVVVADVAGGERPRVHEGEAGWIADFLEGLEAGGCEVGPPDGGSGVEVAIISPYRAQVARIRTILEGRMPGREALWRACVDTVDRFQGGEADVVLVSLCPPAGESVHLADPRRLNVALTRARSKVILLGDVRRLERYEVFRRLFAEYEACWPGRGWLLTPDPSLLRTRRD